MSVTQNIEVSVSEGLICEMRMRLRPFVFVRIITMAAFRKSSIKGLTLQYSVGVAKPSVERGFLVL